MLIVRKNFSQHLLAATLIVNENFSQYVNSKEALLIVPYGCYAKSKGELTVPYGCYVNSKENFSQSLLAAMFTVRRTSHSPYWLLC